MRNYKSFLVIISFLVLTMMTGFEVKAQCPTDFTFEVDTLTVDSCDYIVEICYHCIPTHNAMYVSVISFGKVDTNCVHNPPMTTSEILDNIYAQLNDPNYIEQLCGLDIPPCVGPGSGILDLTEKRNNCWRKYKDYNGNIVYKVCPGTEGDFCEMVFHWCYDPLLQEAIYTYTGPTQYGIPGVDCPKEEADVKDPLLPGEYSDCFHINTNCD